MRARHRKGRGIHPPFAFELVSKVVFDGESLGNADGARAYRRKMLHTRTELELKGQGAGSRITKNSRRSIASLARYSSISNKQGMLLFRLARWYNPRQILELGTGIGISTAFLAAASAQTEIISVEGEAAKSALAKEEFSKAGITNIDFINAVFEDCLPGLIEQLPGRSIIFVDGDHRYEPTVNTVQRILDRKLEEVIILLDDIYWSDEMERAWRFLCKDKRISLSVDLFYMGILVCRPGMEKQHYNVTF